MIVKTVSVCRASIRRKLYLKLEDLGDDDIALGPHLEWSSKIFLFFKVARSQQERSLKNSAGFTPWASTRIKASMHNETKIRKNANVLYCMHAKETENFYFSTL